MKLTVPVPRETLDLEFWERYAKHDKALYYLYHLFRDRPMQGKLEHCLISGFVLGLFWVCFVSNNSYLYMLC